MLLVVHPVDLLGTLILDDLWYDGQGKQIRMPPHSVLLSHSQEDW